VLWVEQASVYIYGILGTKTSDDPFQSRDESSRDGPWPHPTRAHFRPAVNKERDRLWPQYFLTWREKMEKFGIFEGNF